MAPSLLTAGQSRWLLHILVVLLSGVAIASSAPQAAGGVSMYSGSPGDIRGLIVVLGICGLGGVLSLRSASLMLPISWRIYIERVEFIFVSILWICWTSATMAFSAFILSQGVCSSVLSEIYLPACPILTFDLSLLHLLSTATFALLLVVLSTALSLRYHADMSSTLAADGIEIPQAHLRGAGKPGDGTDVFVMWELALADTPLGGYGLSTSNDSTGTRVQNYGTVDSMRILVQSEDGASSTTAESHAIPVMRDKFAQGRVLSYTSLALCSIGVIVASGMVLDSAVYRLSSAFIISVGGASLIFAGILLLLHRRQRGAKLGSDAQFDLRQDRAWEVALAGVLYLLWPLAAIVYTLFPPTPNRPCTNRAASAAPEPPLPQYDSGYLCYLSSAAVVLAWAGSWIILARVLGLIFPMPDVGKPLSGGEFREGETQSLLNTERSGERPQVKWRSIAAQEAFELGGTDDDDDDDDQG